LNKILVLNKDTVQFCYEILPLSVERGFEIEYDLDFLT